MKSLLLCSAILSGAVLYSSCSHKLMPEGHFQDTPVIVDGRINDWGLPLRFSNPEYSMQYAVTHDNKNFYVCIYSKYESMQMRILKAGMTIYFDPKGKKDKKMSLVFPIKKPVDPAENRNGNPIRSGDLKSEIDELLLQSDYYNTTGFLNIGSGQFGINDKKNNIQVAIRFNEDSSLVYEAAVPISYVLGADLKPGYVPANFSVGVAINQLPARNNNNGYRPRSSYGGGMRGMRMGGGGGGGRNYGSGNNPNSKPEENWYQFSLGYKKV